MIKIEDKTKCCGCTACASACPKKCISIKADNEGFLYPVVDIDNCIGCKICERVCPILSPIKEVSFEQTAFLVQNNNNTILKESTSGGAFTAIAEKVIEKNGVVFGVGFDENFVAKHMYVEVKEDLYKFRNSKYVQSEVGDSFEEVKKFLNNGRDVLFSGTPCQIEGLNKYLRKKYDNLISLDVVCRAVPSPLIWDKYKIVKLENEDLKYAWFRNKENFGYQYSQIVLELKNGRKLHAGVESDPYLRAFFSNLSDRPSCYDCQFKKRYRVSDLTIWDCFDVYNIDKSFDDNRGVTRILCHTQKGNDIVKSCNDTCRCVEIDSEKAVYKVRELIHSVPQNEKRNEFFKDVNNMDDKEFFDKWFPKTLKVRASYLIRNVGMKLGIFPFIKKYAKKILGR